MQTGLNSVVQANVLLHLLQVVERLELNFAVLDVYHPDQFVDEFFQGQKFLADFENHILLLHVLDLRLIDCFLQRLGLHQPFDIYLLDDQKQVPEHILLEQHQLALLVDEFLVIVLKEIFSLLRVVLEVAKLDHLLDHRRKHLQRLNNLLEVLGVSQIFADDDFFFYIRRLSVKWCFRLLGATLVDLARAPVIRQSVLTLKVPQINVFNKPQCVLQDWNHRQQEVHIIHFIIVRLVKFYEL